MPLLGLMAWSQRMETPPPLPYSYWFSHTNEPRILHSSEEGGDVTMKCSCGFSGFNRPGVTATVRGLRETQNQWDLRIAKMGVR